MSDTFNISIKPPREDGAANVIDIKPSFITRVRMGIRAFSGTMPNWFGPEAPIPAQAPPQLVGREFDYPTGYNLNYTPKFGEGIGFPTLRVLAESWDMLRLIIETRKDQLCGQEWQIMPRDSSKKSTPDCQAIEDWFRLPDKEHTWEEWLRMVLEDMYVLDAPTLYPRPAKDGTLYSLEPMDGATIKRVIDDNGRTPIAPYIAYQQVIKNVPAWEFTRDELIYRPRNPRTNKVYGYSPVEQIIVLINMALNRQASQLQYYTEGSTPDLILSVPDTWSPEQVMVFKKYWDAVLKGNLGKRRGTMFVHNGMKAVNTKEQILIDKFEEWIARVVCFCFGMSPTPFIQQQTRGAGATMATQAKEEGLEPAMAWVRNLMNYVLAKYFKRPDLCFKWTRDMETDPLTRAQVNNLQARAGKLTINEWRQQDGQDPIEGGDVAMIYTASGAVPLDRCASGEILDNAAMSNSFEGEPGQGGSAKGAANAKPNRSGKQGAPTRSGKQNQPTRNANDKTGPRGSSKSMNKVALYKAKKDGTRPVTKVETKLAMELTPLLHKLGSQTLAGLLKQGYGRHTLGTPLAQVDSLLGGISYDTSTLIEPVEAALGKVIEAGYKAAVSQVMAKAAPVAEGDAAEYAAARAASLVSEIEETTRNLLRGTIEKALEEGWTVIQLADALVKEYAFSAQRAATIAATEINDALTHAELSAWENTGVVKAVEWSKSNLEGVCEVCEGNAEEGAVPLGSLFKSGDDGPPAHPNCRCSLIPVVEL
jgi:hypothetical protein